MFLDIDNRFTATAHDAPPLPYTYLGDDLISDFKIDGKWVKTVGTGKNKKTTLAYRRWSGMIGRVTSRRASTRSYIGCTISDTFMDFQSFTEWCQHQVGYENIGWQLDKDILSDGDKRYSESTCCFVPQEINNLFLKREASRGKCPIGVSERNGKFYARCNVGSGHKVCLGCYGTPAEAFRAYKSFKEQLMRQTAADHREQIAPRVYDALRYYSVSITD